MSEEDIKRGKTDQKVKDVFYDVACAAHQHLETVSINLNNLSPWTPAQVQLSTPQKVKFLHYIP